MEAALEQIVHSLSVALGERHSGTRFHSERVIGLSRALGIQIDLSEKEMQVLTMGARLHDIGKIAIPDRVLTKPSSFEEAEWECMKQHPLIGERIVKAIGDKQALEVATIVRHHHEHFDGSGYPDKLEGTAIPLFSRIISLADSYDAITECRAYHKARSHREVMDILVAETGIKHDPDLLHAFCAVVDKPENRPSLA